MFPSLLRKNDSLTSQSLKFPEILNYEKKQVPKTTRHGNQNKSLFNYGNNFQREEEQEQSNLLPSISQTVDDMNRKYNLKENIVKSYAADTNIGLFKQTNEDRVSIVLSINKAGYNDCNACFFGVYDGHGGSICADFLRDNLHCNVIQDINFPNNPKQALINGFLQTEREFIQQSSKVNSAQPERSGSCACVVLIVGSIAYVANVGDSRAIMSIDFGRKVLQLSNDHKPFSEKERIRQAGGSIYQVPATGMIRQEDIP